MCATGAVGLGAVVWGILSSVRVIVFDGVFTLAGILLVGMSLVASRVSGSAPTRDYPFGMHAATPLAVGLQGAALLGTTAYGATDAVIVLVGGGSEVSGVSVLAYGIATALVSLAVILVLRPHARASSLARAEEVAWRAGLLMSLVVAVGGAVALWLASRDSALVPYVDPALVLIACATVLPMAVSLVRESVRELLEASPAEPLRSQIHDAIRDGLAASASPGWELPEPIVRATKLGQRLYVEVDFVVRPGEWTVDDEDVVRRGITARLDALGHDSWVTVELTTDPALAEDATGSRGTAPQAGLPGEPGAV
jgi:predicted Co/Zn/Cd cation transporter (cation efflux family)